MSIKSAMGSVNIKSRPWVSRPLYMSVDVLEHVATYFPPVGLQPLMGIRLATSNERIETRPDACPIARTLFWTAAHVVR
jgi:hypothetical protein